MPLNCNLRSCINKINKLSEELQRSMAALNNWVAKCNIIKISNETEYIQDNLWDNLKEIKNKMEHCLNEGKEVQRR